MKVDNMGRPAHFSADLPTRCMQLIDQLWDRVQECSDPREEDLGPLSSTFLLSLAAPIINLPIERIERQASQHIFGYADDRGISPELDQSVRAVISGRPFRKSPFFVPDAWSYALVAANDAFNIADGLPDPIAYRLEARDAYEVCANLPTSLWVSIVRNALAHGGVDYLNEHGCTSFGQRTMMYAFISAKLDKERKFAGLHVLRIGEAEFKAFLREWVAWLKATAIDPH